MKYKEGYKVNTKHARHKKILENLHDTYVDKNNKYGDAFADTLEKYGNVAALTRMYDKFSRIETMILNEIEDSEESVIDSALDLANYLVMFVMELENHIET